MLRPFHTLLHVVICFCVLLGVIAQRLKAVKLLGQQLPTFLLFRDHRSVGPKNNVGSICTALPTLLGPRTRNTHGLQSLMGWILPIMHCRSQHCWESLHPFAHHCRHERNNSQRCWSQQCWELLHPFAHHCQHERNNSQRCWSQQCWELLRPFARSLNCSCCSLLDLCPYNGFCEV